MPAMGGGRGGPRAPARHIWNARQERDDEATGGGGDKHGGDGPGGGGGRDRHDQTVFGWQGTHLVAVRCIATKTVAVYFSYMETEPEARDIIERLRPFFEQ